MKHRRKRLVREIANLAPRKVLASLSCDPQTGFYVATDQAGVTYRISVQEVMNVR